MHNLRIYGSEPYKVVVVHGGPGAAGEMAPVAQVLSERLGVLEPLQTEGTVQGQIDELKDIITQNVTQPIILIGYSWGAWLGYMLASMYPSLVKKLILISSGPFESKYVKSIMSTRLSRLSKQDKLEAMKLLGELNNQKSIESKALERFGSLISQADSFDPMPNVEVGINIQQDIFQSVWQEASNLRQTGELLRFGQNIQCPVVAIHGDYDPHPAIGVQEPLTRVVKDFRFLLLENCGHKPWIERVAKDRFYQILFHEID